ncbi:MAG: amidohydrolase family protein, partial [Woeseiaceae bacterium]
MKIIASVLLGIVLAAGNCYADTLIHAGRLIDGQSDNAVTEMTIRVDGHEIEALERGYAAALPDDTVIDLKNHTVMPGLMDMHVHLTGEYSEDDRLKDFITNEADYAIDAVKFARRTLEAGFTVVRNPGDAFNVTVALREAIEDGDVPGPRIFTAGKSLATETEWEYASRGG